MRGQPDCLLAEGTLAAVAAMTSVRVNGARVRNGGLVAAAPRLNTHATGGLKRLGMETPRQFFVREARRDGGRKERA